MRKARRRRYQIQDDQYAFRSGHLLDGHQILAAIQIPEVVAVLFSPGGDFVEARTVRPIHGSSSDISLLSLSRAMHEWLETLGFQSGTITVHQFWIPERFIGIKELPRHYSASVVAEISDLSEKDAIEQERVDWHQRRNFVLWWSEEFFLNRRGEIDST